MKRTLYTLAWLLMAASVTLSGCKKKEGCTDEDATNYDSQVKSKNDDGSCSYEGQYTIWFDYGFADYYVDKFPISIRLDGTTLGTLDYDDYQSATPACDAAGTATFTLDLGSSKSKDYELKVADANGDEFYIYTITVEANECLVGRL